MSVVVGSQQQQQSEAEQSQVRRLNLAAESSQNAVQAQHLFVMRHGHRLDTADRKWRRVCVCVCVCVPPPSAIDVSRGHIPDEVLY